MTCRGCIRLDIPRCIAGVFSGAVSLLLIYQGHVTEGSIIATAMLAFFVGEKNGKATAKPEA